MKIGGTVPWSVPWVASLATCSAKLAEDQHGRAGRQSRTLQVGLESSQYLGSFRQHPIAVGRATRRTLNGGGGIRILAADLVQPLLLLELHERAVRYHFPTVVLDGQIRQILGEPPELPLGLDIAAYDSG